MFAHHNVHRFYWTVATVFLVSISGRSLAASIPWRDDVRNAVNEATQTGKPLLIEVATSWCHYCRKMDQETFSNPEIVDRVSECFVPVKLDGDADREIAQQLGVQSFPTMVIVSPQWKVIASIKGFRTSRQLSGDLSALCAQRKSQLPTIANVRTELDTPSVFADYCPVTSFLLGTLVKSGQEYPLRFHGFDLQFASRAAREQFRAEPDQFWPIADGYCIVSALDGNSVTLGKLSHGMVFADRIWLFSSSEHKQRFVERPAYYFQKLADYGRSQPSKAHHENAPVKDVVRTRG